MLKSCCPIEIFHLDIWFYVEISLKTKDACPAKKSVIKCLCKGHKRMTRVSFEPKPCRSHSPSIQRLTIQPNSSTFYNHAFRDNSFQIRKDFYHIQYRALRILKLKNVHPGAGGAKNLQVRRKLVRMFVKDEKIILLIQNL